MRALNGYNGTVVRILNVVEQFASRSDVHRIVAMLSGAALLIAAAVFISAIGLPLGQQGAAVVCSTSPCTDSNTDLSLTAAQGVLQAGASTTLTWSSSNVVDTVSSVSCYGNNSGCATTLIDNTVQTLSANAPTDAEMFAIGGNSYLVAANNSSASSPLYKWITSLSCFGNGTACNKSFQNIPSSGALDFEPFALGGNSFLSLSNGVGSISGTYKWFPSAECLNDGITCGVPVQNNFPFETCDDAGCSSFDPEQWSYFSIAGEHYIALAYSASVSRVYKWGGSSFSLYQSFGSSSWSTRGFEFFTIGADSYLAMANNNGNTSRIYKWTPSGTGCPAQGGWGNGTACASGTSNSLQTIAINAFDLESFQVGADSFLILSRGINNTQPLVFKWMPPGTPASNTLGCFGNGVNACATTSAFYQQIKSAVSAWDTQAGTDVEYFKIDSLDYIVVSVNNNTKQSVMYRWVANTAPNTDAPREFCFGGGSSCGVGIQNGLSWGYRAKYFTIDTDSYLVTAPKNTNTNSFLYKWMPPPANGGNGCFGDGAVCTTYFQKFPVGVSGAANFSAGANNYLALSSSLSTGSNLVYKWMSRLEESGGTPTNTLGGGSTFVERSWRINNGATVSSIGAYATSPQTFTVKIVKRNSTGNYDIVVSESFSHPGGGWQDKTLSTPYVVPATNDYHAGIYSASAIASYTAARAEKVGDITGVGQTFGEGNSVNTPTLRVKYQAASGNCFGDGVNCESEVNRTYSFQRFLTSGETWEPFTIDGVSYLASSGAEGAFTGGPAVFRFGATSCFGSASGVCNEYYQNFDKGATNASKIITVGSNTYLVSLGTVATSYMYRWMPAQNCFGNGTICNVIYQSFATDRAKQVDTFAVDSDRYLAVANEGSGSVIYKWTTTEVAPCSAGGGWGNGSACGSAYQTGFTSSAQSVKSFTVGTDPNPYLAIITNSGANVGGIYKWTPSGTGCPAGGGMGNGTACGGGSRYQTFQASDLYSLRIFTASGADLYLAVVRSGFAESSLYKWTEGTGCPAQGGWGDGNTCNSSNGFLTFLQRFSTTGGRGWTTPTFIDSNLYLGLADSTNNVVRLYKAISPACFGNGVGCDIAYQSIPATGRNWRYFTLGPNPEDRYLALAKGGDLLVYRWLPAQNCFGSGSTCGSVFQSVGSSHEARDAEVFSPDGGSTYYLVVPRREFGTGSPSLRVFRWLPSGNGGVGCFGLAPSTCGTSHQSFDNLDEAWDAEIFQDPSNGSYYMLVGRSEDRNNARLLKWMPSGTGCPSGGGFGDGTACGIELQTIWSNNAQDIEIFTIGTLRYAAITSKNGNILRIHAWLPSLQCFGVGSTCATSSQTGGYYQEIITNTPVDLKFFQIDGVYYLAEARASPSRIYKWSGTCFGDSNGTCGSVFQSITTNAASEWRPFTVGATTYLAVANENTPSSIYQWMPAGTPSSNTTGCLGDGAQCGAVWNSIPTNSALDWEYFSFDSTNNYLAVANGNGSQSTIYKFSTGGGGSTPGCSVYQYDATTGTTTLAVSNNNSTGLDTGPLTENTRYTLSCNTSTGGLQDVAVTVTLAGLPTVSIAATDATAAEMVSGADTGTFTISRTGSTVSALTVNFAVSGTATSGTDYTSLGTSVSIPAGQASTPVTVTPINDTLTEVPPETVIVTLSTNAAYILGTPSSAQVTIADNDTNLDSIDDDWVYVPTVNSDSLTISPARVRKGSTTQVSWNVTGLIPQNTCSITSSPNVFSASWNQSGTSWSGGPTASAAIQSQTVFTLTCTAPDGVTQTSPVSKTVNLIPSVQEI